MFEPRLREQGDKAMKYRKVLQLCNSLWGDFIFSKPVKYNSSSVAYFDSVSCDNFSQFQICGMVEKLGLEGPFGLYWRVPGSALSKVYVRPLRSDSDCMQLINSLPKKRYTHIYLQKRPNVTEKNNEGDEGDLEGGDDDEVVVEDEVSVENDLEVEDDLEVEEEVAVEEDIGVEEEVAAEEEIGLEDDLEVEEEIGVEDLVVEEEMDVEEEEEVEEEDARENREEFDDSDTEFRADEEEQQENIGIGIRVQRQMDGFGVDGVRVNPEIESDSDKSDELHSDHDSDSDSPRFSEFNNETDMVNPKFVKGLIFSDRNVLKEAIKHYGRVNRVQVKLQKNDTKRIQDVCQETCPWKLWAAPMNPKDITDQTWQIKTLVDSHTCSKVTKNRNIRSTWMAKYYIGKFMVDINYPPKSLRNDVYEEFVTWVSHVTCGRARELAIEMIEGNYKGQYARIYEYLLELRTTNPGTTTICHLDARLFQRMYVCLQACKNGFIQGCRRIICVDGCYLKGYFQGYLLAAVGIDANDGIYPIAYAAVESENYASWHWFLDILKNDLQIGSICFMSDKQKGLLEAIDDIFPNAEVRNCVRHLYNNFKELHKGKALKDVVWKAARATYSREFEAAMDQLKALSVPAYEWIKKINPAQWSKSHFSTRSKCDMLLNNLCESFNKVILEARDKPILTMMEVIRTKLMKKVVSKREEAEKWPGPLCGVGPHVLVEKDIKFKVVLDTSMLWTLCSIHVHAGGGTSVESPVSMQSQQFKRPIENLKTMSMSPEQWSPVTEMEPILPPSIRRPPGRPTKKRRKEADEVNNPKLCKRGQQSNCSKCGMSGHNKRTCRGQIGANQPVKRPTPSSHGPANHHPPSNQQHQPSSTHQQQPSSSQQQPSSSQQQQPQRQKLPPRRQPLAPPTQVNQMPSSQQSNVSNPPNQESQASTRD
ncbi:hypothetical protein GQ457_18G014420 [Hibiscus cannabinus]